MTVLVVVMAATPITLSAAHAGFTVKLFSESVDTESDVASSSPLGGCDRERAGFQSDQTTSFRTGWPLACVEFGAQIDGCLYVGATAPISS